MRQVYFDPFGSRLEGLHQGFVDESQHQANVRTARASDYDYNNMAPIRLQQAQREEAYQQFADPSRRQLAPLEVRANAAHVMGQEQPFYDALANRTGDGSASIANLHNFGMGTDNYLSSAPLFAPQVQMYRDIFSQNPAYTQAKPDDYFHELGSHFGVSGDVMKEHMSRLPYEISPRIEQGNDNYLNYERARQQGIDQWGMRNDTFNQGVKGIELQNQTDANAVKGGYLGIQEGYYNQKYGNGNGPSGNAGVGAYVGAPP